MEPRKAIIENKIERIAVYVHLFYSDADGEASIVFERRDGTVDTVCLADVDLRLEPATGTQMAKRE